MNSKAKLDDQLERVRMAALDAGSFLVTATVNPGDDRGRYNAYLPLDEFLTLLSPCRPRIVYLRSDTFESKEAVLDSLAGGGEADSWEEDASVEALIKRWAIHDGEIGMFSASFFMEGVLHFVLEDADWLQEFEQEFNACPIVSTPASL
jgi:hypothetical protein